MKYYAILVAGGSGSRMNSALPKQFLLLNGRPVLMHTIEAFYFSGYRPQIIVSLHPDYHTYWADCCRVGLFTIPHQVVAGGETRFRSVKNGLEAITEDAIIAVHDAVRPVVSNEIISTAFQVAEERGSAVTAVKSRDSIRQQNGSRSEALDRDHIFLVQTPQTFQSGILKKAYDQPYDASFTDDATVVEKMGLPINLIEGSSKNIKITFPEDIFIASHFLNNR